MCVTPFDNAADTVYTADTMTGEELRRARVRLKLTQKQLGEQIGIHKNSIARMERGEMAIVRPTELAVKYLLVMSKRQGGKTSERV